MKVPINFVSTSLAPTCTSCSTICHLVVYCNHNIPRRSAMDSSSCTICFAETPVAPTSGDFCAHVFCNACLEKWFRVQNKCPTCRAQLRNPNDAFQHVQTSAQPTNDAFRPQTGTPIVLVRVFRRLMQEQPLFSEQNWTVHGFDS